MIRINLLSEGRRPVVARRARPKIGLGDQDPSLLLLAGGLLLGLLIAGIWWFSLNSKIKEVNREISTAQAEVERLKPILEEVANFKEMQAELERKISIIKDLTLKQSGPVHIMDQVSRALPDLVWLNQMNFRGAVVDLRGVAFNTNAIAAFIENLDQVPEFREPDTKDISRDRSGSTYSFNISFRFDQKPLDAGPEATNGDGQTEAAATSP